MKVRQKKAASYKGETPKPQAEMQPYPAPIKGWVLNQNVRNAPVDSALVLDNWFCTTTGVRVRGGKSRFATLGGAVTSLFSYKSGAFERFFGATSDSIYEITAPGDPDAIPTADISGQTSGDYSVSQFGTAGGNYLYVVNGADSAQIYDGTSWQAVTDVSTPIAVTGVATADLSVVWSYASRLFFVEKDSMKVWYLSVDSIGGAASDFSLAGVFKKGGSLLFGATWSLDAGDGLDDKCVFVSTEGEVAVYEGTNPGDANNWYLVGVYNIAEPLGKNALMQAGGDLLIATAQGLVPVSEAVRKDPSALAPGAVSYPIAPYWEKQVRAKLATGWEVLKWPERNMMVVSQPDGGPENGSCLVANLLTGAWSRFTGWDTQCLGYFGGIGYFGSGDGRVYAMESGGSDDGATYTCGLLYQHSSLQPVGVQKTLLEGRATFTAATPIAPQISAQVNYTSELSPAPNSVADYTSDTWDGGDWDVAIWDGGVQTEVETYWASIGRSGEAVAPEVQLTFGVTPTPLAEFAGFDAVYAVGAVVT